GEYRRVRKLRQARALLPAIHGRLGQPGEERGDPAAPPRRGAPRAGARGGVGAEINPAAGRRAPLLSRLAASFSRCFSPRSFGCLKETRSTFRGGTSHETCQAGAGTPR